MAAAFPAVLLLKTIDRRTDRDPAPRCWCREGSELSSFRKRFRIRAESLNFSVSLITSGHIRGRDGD